MTLLHTCCGPCSSACVPRLKELGREVTMLFANSNIDTREEFERRLAEARKVAEVEGVRLESLPYDHDEWLAEVASGYECECEQGARCERCFRYNLTKAAQFAAEHGIREFTTSLTVSPHKVSAVVFRAGKSAEGAAVSFLAEDFKKHDGFMRSVRRTQELGLYRQDYCGCEFSKTPHWQFHHRVETESTNLDARSGLHGDVFTAYFQRSGRGRLDHRWLSPPGTNLMMSVVLDVADIAPDRVATLPLAVGLAVARAADRFIGNDRARLKWPNDVLVNGRKLSGILCERVGDLVIAGIGVNVGQREFAPEIAGRATSLAMLSPDGSVPSVERVLKAVLRELGAVYAAWRFGGLDVLKPHLDRIDALKGTFVSVSQTDGDERPVSGICGGINPDGSLDIAGIPVYAGEAHVKASFIDGRE